MQITVRADVHREDVQEERQEEPPKAKGRGRSRTTTTTPPTTTTTATPTATASGTATATAGKKADKLPIAVMNSLAEAMAQNPCLWDKAHEHYYKKDVKDNAWARIASDNNLTVERVTRWWNSYRTRYGRLTRPGPSGSGVAPDDNETKLKNWTVESLSFLGSNVARIKTRGGVDVSYNFPLF